MRMCGLKYVREISPKREKIKFPTRNFPLSNPLPSCDRKGGRLPLSQELQPKHGGEYLLCCEVWDPAGTPRPHLGVLPGTSLEAAGPSAQKLHFSIGVGVQVAGRV